MFVQPEDRLGSRVTSHRHHQGVAIAPSPRTRRLFREYLVGTTLGYISDVFGDAGLQPEQLPPELIPGGQRRGLVEEFYFGLDWSSASAIRKVLSAYEHILFDVEGPDEKARLVSSLRLDGFQVDDNGRISTPATLDLGIEPAALYDVDALAGYERRILESIATDPELAIGSSKELVEAVAKLLLDEAGPRRRSRPSTSRSRTSRTTRLAPSRSARSCARCIRLSSAPQSSGTASGRATAATAALDSVPAMLASSPAPL